MCTDSDECVAAPKPQLHLLQGVDRPGPVTALSHSASFVFLELSILNRGLNIQNRVWGYILRHILNGTLQ